MTNLVGMRVRVLFHSDVWYGEVRRVDPNFGQGVPGNAINIYVEPDSSHVDGETRCFEAMCWLEDAQAWRAHNGRRFRPEIEITLADSCGEGA